ncbi:response regulator [Palleronia sp. KMU-117]|uniref:response regulator n=1 Tax=Palleronia sp. KMU-117 TaxID=3434108 RepID=UPI003D72F86A
MGEHTFCIAIVDDDPGVGRALRRLAISLGHEAFAFTSGNALLYGMGAAPPTHVLLDLHMPAPSGPALVARVLARWPEARILVMSGLETEGAADACRAAGASLLLRKPLRADDLEKFLAS